MNMWLYIGIRAEFINSALWRRSVGGVVASILLFIRLASVFLIVSSIVLSIVFPRKIPRCLQVSGDSIPFWFRPCIISGEVFMHRAVVFLMLMLRKRMLDIGSPCPDPVRTVMRIPFFHLLPHRQIQLMRRIGWP